MDWISFFLGFLAFPLMGAVALALLALTGRLRRGERGLAQAAQRGSTLSFSPRLIGEIGEALERDRGPAAKAS